VGQLNLNQLLKAPEMRQLDQRVSIRYELKPLTRDEVASYVSHRLTVAGGSAVLAFQPKALDVVHRRTQGIPRLVNLVCDRALLAAYSARANKVTPAMVEKAAENLELAAPRSPLLGWFRKRASAMLTTAGIAVALTAAGVMAAPVMRTPARYARPALPAAKPVQATTQPSVAAAPAAVPADEPQTPVPVAYHYAVMAASFPVKELLRDGSAASVGLDAVKSRLQALGYVPWLTDVDLKTRGEWRRVLVGQFETLQEAVFQATQLQQSEAFADAQPIRY